MPVGWNIEPVLARARKQSNLLARDRISLHRANRSLGITEGGGSENSNR